MRRSLRDAIVGFSLLGGIATFAGTMFWLQGIKFRSNSWEITANFDNATGLAERSPVTYKGILVGSVGKILITPRKIKAKLEINQRDLILNKPVIAKITSTSLLGGDTKVTLISKGKYLSEKSPLPISKECIASKILCKGDEIEGVPLMSISTLTEELEEILKKAGKENIVSSLSSSTRQFDLTQKNLDELIAQLKLEVSRAEPMISNLNQATLHIANILSAIDNPTTLNNIQETASSASSLTKKMDNLGVDLERMVNDAELMSAIRNITIGLGQLFEELYPERN